MQRETTDAANRAIELIKAHKFYLESNNTPDFATIEEAKTVTLYYDDVKDIYQCFFDYESRLLELQNILKREIKLTDKSYGTQMNGVFAKEALLDAITLIKSNNHTVQQSNKHR